MKNEKLFMVIIKTMAIAFIVFVAYTEGHHKATEECIDRANKINKEFYSAQELEIIIFGEKQE